MKCPYCGETGDRVVASRALFGSCHYIVAELLPKYGIHTELVDGQMMVKLGGIASTSVVFITLLAPLMGYLLHKKKLHTALMSVIALGIALVSVLVGLTYPITLDPRVWMVILSGYMVLAAAIPVWLLLQPRDFVNVNFLYIGLFGMFIAILINGFGGFIIIHFQAIV